jgi:MFS family permease
LLRSHCSRAAAAEPLSNLNSPDDQPSGGAASAKLPQITVEAQRKDTERRVHEFVSRVAALSHYESLARWTTPICPKDLLIGLGARITEVSWIYVITIFGLSYAVTNIGLPRGLVLGAIAVGAVVELITIPVFGALSDRVGRRPVYMLGCLAAIALSFPIFWAIQTRDPLAVVLGFAIGMSVGHGIMYGVQASFLSEMFPSNLRYSGASLGYQLAAPIGGGLIPVIAAAIVGQNHGATWPVSTLMIALALVTMLAVLRANETAPAVAKPGGGLQKAEAVRAG